MPYIIPSDGQSWDSNVYIQASTRVFAIFGVGYLVRFLYYQVSSTWGSRSASIMADIVNALSLGAISSDTPATAPVVTGFGPDLEANITLEARLPHGGADAEDRLERSQVNPRAYNQHMEVPMSSAIAERIPEQDAGVRVNDTHSDVDRGIAVGLDD